MNTEQERGVMSEDTRDALFDVKGFGGLDEIEHPHYQWVDQIKFFHAPQVKVNLIQRLPDLPQASATKFSIKIKIFNLLFLVGPQHLNLDFL